VSYRIILRDDFAKERFIRVVRKAPNDYVGIVEEQKRSNAQNDKMWAMLTDIALAAPDGRKLEPRKWKNLFMDALERELNDAAFGSQWEPGLDGEGVVNLGHRSSRLNKSQMGELLSFIEAWGTQKGVQWSEQAKDEAA
jgi:hypothetical protein